MTISKLKAAGALALAGTLALTLVAAAPRAGYGQSGDKPAKEKEVAKVGEKAPDFTLTDTDGNEFTLSEVLADDSVKAVVLEWFNPECPFVVKHHKTFTTMSDIYGAHKDDGVRWMAINSGAPGKQGAGLDLNKRMKSEWKIAYPVLLDESGDVGRAYGAKTTPHMFVINGDGVLVYAGAIDDNRSPQTLGETNHVKDALQAVLAGESVDVAQTRPYGCSVKY